MGFNLVIILISASLSMFLSPASSSVVKLSLVIPDQLRVTDVNLRFENNRPVNGPGGSFEGEMDPEDQVNEVVRGLPDRMGKINRQIYGGQRNDNSHLVETFPGASTKAEERHNVINKVIKLQEDDLGPIRK